MNIKPGQMVIYSGEKKEKFTPGKTYLVMSLSYNPEGVKEFLLENDLGEYSYLEASAFSPLKRPLKATIKN